MALMDSYDCEQTDKEMLRLIGPEHNEDIAVCPECGNARGCADEAACMRSLMGDPVWQGEKVAELVVLLFPNAVIEMDEDDGTVIIRPGLIVGGRDGSDWEGVVNMPRVQRHSGGKCVLYFDSKDGR